MVSIEAAGRGEGEAGGLDFVGTHYTPTNIFIVRTNKPFQVHCICLHEDGLNDQIRVTDSAPHWGWSGKPGIPEGKRRVGLDELLMF